MTSATATGFANEYFDNGLLKKTTMPNGAVVDQLFDPVDRLVSRIVRKPDLAMTQLSAWTRRHLRRGRPTHRQFHVVSVISA